MLMARGSGLSARRSRRRLLVRLAAATWIITAAGACRPDDAPPADGRTATWLDISPAIGDPPRDPGDALALLQAYGAGTLGVRGVSVIFGNVPLERGLPAALELLQRMDTGLRRAWRGASAADERAAPTEATELLEEALRKEPLTIVATGPATTIASLLLRKPAMARRIERVILVAGTGIDDATLAGTTDGDADAVVHADAGSVQVLLDSPIALTLVRPGPLAGVALDAADLDRLDQGVGPVKLIVPSAREWLQAATRREGITAIAVPAMLAVDVAAHPGKMRCEPAAASFGRSGPAGPRLLIENSPTGRKVTWCHSADPEAKARIIADVLRVRAVPH